MLTTLRLWWYRAAHFVDEFKDEAPACCGTCRACAGASAVAVTGLVISSVRRGELPFATRHEDRAQS
jgi:hypothetical protein